jgi:hypothetical protein
VGVADSFNLLNRDKPTYAIADSGYYSSAGKFVKYSQHVAEATYPAYYQQPTSLMKPSTSFAPRQMQFSARFNF